MDSSIQWRGAFTNAEIAALHLDAFGGPPGGRVPEDWRAMTDRHSLGWVVARDSGRVVGFVNVVTDGGVHAWVQDTMVATTMRHHGLGTKMLAMVRAHALEGPTEWLHVDFAPELSDFYLGACGFEDTTAGLMHLGPPSR